MSEVDEAVSAITDRLDPEFVAEAARSIPSASAGVGNCNIGDTRRRPMTLGAAYGSSSQPQAGIADPPLGRRIRSN